MAKYKFTIWEQLVKEVTIEADSYKAAENEVVNRYVDADIVLTADDWASTQIENDVGEVIRDY